MINASDSTQLQPPTPTIDTASNPPAAIDPLEHDESKQPMLPHKIQFYLVKSVAVLLILQGLWSLFNSIRFIFIELPSLEQQLSLGQINSSQINTFANKAIIMTVSTVLSLFFALRVTALQSKAAKTISIVMAVLLVVGNTQINTFLNQMDSSQLITSTVIETLRSVLSF